MNGEDTPYSLAVSCYHHELTERSYAIYLASKIITKTTKNYPKPYLLNRFLYRLNGLEADVTATKWGDQLLLNFDLSVFYLQTDLSKRKAIFDYFTALSEKCRYENGQFPEKIFIEEKRSVIKEIQIQNMDPVQVHFQKFLEKMFSTEPFRYSLLGKEEQVSQCTNAEVSTEYAHFISQADRISLEIGNFSPQELAILHGKGRKLPKKHLFQPSSFPKKSPVYFEEESDNQQTWVFLGFRHDITSVHPLYPALSLYQQILGKIPDALLIQRLREELSLCYNVELFIPSGKEAMFITAGILLHDKGAFLEEIEYLMTLFPYIRKKTTYLSMAKKKVLNTMYQWKDFPSLRLNFALESQLNDSNISLHEYCQKIEQVRWEDLQNVSQHIWLDTVFISRGKYR